MHCHVLVPGFGWPHGEEEALLGSPAPRALQTLIARGRRSRDFTDEGVSPERWLLERFGVERQRDWPAAPFRLLGDGGSPGEAAWICAEPVHLRFERNRLMLLDSTLFAIAREEADALAASVNSHFGDTLEVHPQQPHRWYARLPECPDMETTPLASVRGGAIEAALAQGPDAMRWQAIANELQMLLHDHPVNLAREARGDPAVNSLWLWGAGRLGTVTAQPFQHASASDPLARGLAQACGAQARMLPGNAQDWFAQGDAPGPGLGLIVLDALAAPLQYAQADTWRDAFATLERDWFAPLMEALRDGRLGMLTLHLLGPAQTLQVEVTRSDLRRFWRVRRPLARWLD